ncbi:MAG: glutamate-5-semialdehyde dehydrogenase [Methanomassiliicoccales archaeon]|nr:glutamate-5-semialdehyde dehydrogenase [Methanomassiliicoccales archaeon]
MERSKNSVASVAIRAKEAALRMQGIPHKIRNEALLAIARALEAAKDRIIAANLLDLKRAEESNLPSPMIKRLKYDDQKIEESINSLNSLINLEDPIGKTLMITELDEGLLLEKVTCPIGVICVIFESRPDALVQISSLCIKSSNAVILKGGSEANHTNEILAEVIEKALLSVDERFNGAVQLLSTREEIKELLKLDDLIDLVIPRGSNELVRSIKESTRIPVLGHAAGVCHTYVDDDADLEMALNVCYDAKVQYPAVCNAMETLLVHEKIAPTFLPKMASLYAKAGVRLKGDERTRKFIEAEIATEKDWSIEYNDLVLNIKTVSSLEEAIDHINKYGSHHTDAIITRSREKAERFMDLVDSSSVMWNCSTRFADGYRYGLGAEVGISTNKTHARGPVGLEGLVIYKYRLIGNGQVVADYVGKNAKKFIHRRLV